MKITRLDPRQQLALKTTALETNSKAIHKKINERFQ